MISSGNGTVVAAAEKDEIKNEDKRTPSIESIMCVFSAVVESQYHRLDFRGVKNMAKKRGLSIVLSGDSLVNISSQTHFLMKVLIDNLPMFSRGLYGMDVALSKR